MFLSCLRVIEGVNGFKIDPDDVEDLAQKLKALVRNRHNGNTLSLSAAASVKEKFSIAKSAQGFVDLLEFLFPSEP